MARGVRLDTLRLRVQRAADIEGASARFPNAELLDYINESLAELYDLIRAAYGQDYYRKPYSIATTGGTASYALPSDFLDLISVDIALGGNLVLTAKPYMENERNAFKFWPIGAGVIGGPVYYRLTGAQGTGGTTTTSITFMPLNAYNVTVNYVPTPTLLAADSDTFDGVAGWEQYAVLDAAIKCATKDQQWDLAQALGAQKADMRARIEKMAAERDAGGADRVQDVAGGFPGDWW